MSDSPISTMRNRLNSINSREIRGTFTTVVGEVVYDLHGMAYSKHGASGPMFAIQNIVVVSLNAIASIV